MSIRSASRASAKLRSSTWPRQSPTPSSMLPASACAIFLSSDFPASELGASSNSRARITPLGHRNLPGFVRGHLRFALTWLEFRYSHLGFDRVGNETILVCGMVHFVELFSAGRSISTPGNLRAKLDTSNGHFPFGIFLHMANRLVLVRIEHELLFTRNRQKRKHVTARE
jgi:hypothetical protein